MIVKDAMVVIHLAKVTLLKTSCEHFKPVVLPEAVHQEIMAGRQKGHEDVQIVEELIKAGKLSIKHVKDRKLLKRANEFNIQRGEAEALALYWQEKAGCLATDDDNLRKKGVLLDLKLIGTPAIMLRLYREGLIEKGKLLQSLGELRKIGWFSNAVIDRIMMEIK